MPPPNQRQNHGRRCKSSEILGCVAGGTPPEVSKDRSAFIFKVKQFGKEIRKIVIAMPIPVAARSKT
jgi:hypothetical protein